MSATAPQCSWSLGRWSLGPGPSITPWHGSRTPPNKTNPPKCKNTNNPKMQKCILMFWGDVSTISSMRIFLRLKNLFGGSKKGSERLGDAKIHFFTCWRVVKTIQGVAKSFLFTHPKGELVPWPWSIH